MSDTPTNTTENKQIVTFSHIVHGVHEHDLHPSRSYQVHTLRRYLVAPDYITTMFQQNGDLVLNDPERNKAALDQLLVTGMAHNAVDAYGSVLPALVETTFDQTSFIPDEINVEFIKFGQLDNPGFKDGKPILAKFRTDSSFTYEGFSYKEGKPIDAFNKDQSQIIPANFIMVFPRHDSADFEIYPEHNVESPLTDDAYHELYNEKLLEHSDSVEDLMGVIGNQYISHQHPEGAGIIVTLEKPQPFVA